MEQQNVNHGRDQNIFNQPANVHVYPPTPSSRPRDEYTLLRAVKDEVESRLSSSLHNAVFLNLGKEAQPEQVKRPWEREIKVGSAPATAIPDDTTIAQVFTSPAINGKLLILGQPGSGKTTTLLDLAKALVAQAEADARSPLPVLFNLSSWREEKQPIWDWLVAELKSKYGVTLKLGKRWVAERVILPLLDGLDEVAPERQEQCVQRLNDYLTGESSPLYAVVCSRLAEYEHYETALQLNGAVYLKSLSDEQILSYLSGVGRVELWELLAQSDELLNLLRSPLLLSLSVLAYPQGSREQWSALQTANDQLQYLLDAYVEKMLHREFEHRSYAKRQAPNAQQTRWWLVWLARQMEQSAQTEFLIEAMQPSMLSSGTRSMYRWIFRLFFGLPLGLFLGTVGVLLGLSFGGWSMTIKPVEVLRWSWSNAKSAGALFYGLLYGLLYGLSLGLFVGLVVGLFVGLVFGLLNGLVSESVDLKTVPNQGIKNSARNFLLVGLSFVLLGGLLGGLVDGSFGLLDGLVVGLGLGLVWGPVVGLFFGGFVCLQHFTLRLLLYRSKAIPWNYARFLNYSTERLFLQRVGGRYRFMHKLLQEHFATMPVEP